MSSDLEALTPQAPAPVRCDPDERPATDAQLVLLGRQLGLGFHEAEALLEALGEVAEGPAGLHGERHQALLQLLGEFPPALLDILRAVPGLFLWTDGVTVGRLERALLRLRGTLAGLSRLRRFALLGGLAVEREARLIEGALAALAGEVRSGRLKGLQGPGGIALLELLAPLVKAHEQRSARSRRRLH